MSVLVKGMGMPEKCPDCNFESECGFCLAKSPNFGGYTDELVRPDWCPLVELPENHGRLIDADNLRTWFGEKDLYSYDYITGIIDDERTVVEAEGEG